MGLILGKFSCGKSKSQTNDYTNDMDEINIQKLNERFKRYNSTYFKETRDRTIFRVSTNEQK